MSTEAPHVVLLVEDDPLLRDAFKVLLEDAGVRVLEAESGADALDAVRQRPDIVYLDLGLPDASGLELVRALRREPGLANTPIVALTGRGAGQREACMEAGFTDYLEKPVRPKTLLGHVERLLSGG